MNKKFKRKEKGLKKYKSKGLGKALKYPKTATMFSDRYHVNINHSTPLSLKNLKKVLDFFYDNGIEITFLKTQTRITCEGESTILEVGNFQSPVMACFAILEARYS